MSAFAEPVILYTVLFFRFSYGTIVTYGTAGAAQFSATAEIAKTFLYTVPALAVKDGAAGTSHATFGFIVCDGFDTQDLAMQGSLGAVKKVSNPESNSLPKQPYPVRYAAGLVDSKVLSWCHSPTENMKA
jgi:hypothetical protein